jgi:hypothetical protein
LNEETKEMRKELAEMWHQGIYMPLDTQDAAASMMYDSGDSLMELSYNMPDMMQVAMENMTNPLSKLT